MKSTHTIRYLRDMLFNWLTGKYLKNIFLQIISGIYIYFVL